MTDDDPDQIPDDPEQVPDDPEHVQGIDFTSLNPVLADLTYPISTDELVERHGDLELDRTNADPVSVEDLLAYMGEATFDSKGEVRQTMLAQMPRDSEGRTNYSDRGGSLPERTDAAAEAAEQTSADLQEGRATDTDQTQQ